MKPKEFKIENNVEFSRKFESNTFRKTKKGWEIISIMREKNTSMNCDNCKAKFKKGDLVLMGEIISKDDFFISFGLKHYKESVCVLEKI